MRRLLPDGNTFGMVLALGFLILFSLAALVAALDLTERPPRSVSGGAPDSGLWWESL